jgi:starch phosphorylase
MLWNYLEQIYVPALQQYQNRIGDQGQNATLLSQWRESIQREWAYLHFGKLEIETQPGFYKFNIQVYLNNLDPRFVSIQIYADPVGGEKPEIHQCIKGKKLANAINAYNYSVHIPARRPASHYTPRIIPFHKAVSIPLEANQILWYEPLNADI